MNIKACKSKPQIQQTYLLATQHPKSHSVNAQQILDEKMTKPDGLVQQNGFGLAFLQRMLRHNKV
jgi:hypothetical protein